MAISFSHISSSLRVPLFYAELDASRAGFFQRSLRTLLLGLKEDGTSASDNQLVQVTSAAQANKIFGTGSQLATMVRVYRENDPFSEVWCIPIPEAGSPASLTFTITFATQATGAGTFTFSLAGVPVSVSVTSGQTVTQTAAALAATINTKKGLSGFSATSAAGVVTVSSVTKGAIYVVDEMPVVRTNLPTETAPSAMTATVSAGTAGTGTSPTLVAAVAAMGEQQFDAVVCAFNDDASLKVLKAEFDESAGRWSHLRQVYGHVFAATKGTVAVRTARGERTGGNNPHETIVGVPSHSTKLYTPTPSWLWATAVAAQVIKSASADPARPFQTLPLYGCILDERAADTVSEQNVLLYDGVATIGVSGGVPRISRLITTYRTNAQGEEDTAYLDVTTLYTLAHILRFLRNRITTKYARHKLANDGTRFGEGQPIVTPRILRGELVAAYAQLEEEGLVENRQLFIQNLIVERDSNDPNRVNVLFPPDLVNQLRVFAVVAQFRLQYEAQGLEDETTDT